MRFPHFRKFFSQSNGVATIEFALAFPVFALFFIFITEYGIMMFGNSVIKSVVEEAAHFSKIGCQDAFFNDVTTCDASHIYNQTRIRTEVKDRSLGLVNADAGNPNFQLSVITDVGYAVGTNPGTVDMGQGAQTRVFIVSYKWPVMFEFLQNIGVFGSVMNFRTVTIVRNEPFGTIDNRNN